MNRTARRQIEVSFCPHWPSELCVNATGGGELQADCPTLEQASSQSDDGADLDAASCQTFSTSQAKLLIQNNNRSFVVSSAGFSNLS